MKKNIKKKILLVILFFTGFSLSAQNFREYKIFVPAVDGQGTIGENAFFYKQLAYEVVNLGHTIVRDRRDSDFILKGAVIPYTEDMNNENAVKQVVNSRGMVFTVPDNRAVPSLMPGEFIFSLELLDRYSKEILAQQKIIYMFIDQSVTDLLSITIYNMLSSLPALEKSADWRDKWLYLNTNFLWNPRIYDGTVRSINIANIGFGLSAEFHFHNFISAEIGADITQDWLVYSDVDGDVYRDLILELPLMVKFVLKPLEFYMLEAYGGVQFNFSLMSVTQPYFIAWLTGIQIGLRAGPGLIIIDPRFAKDFAPSSIEGRLQEYSRNMIRIGVGYKFGFFPKKKR